jgi:hypothetical protein
MGRVLGLLGLLFALAIGGYLWMERSRNMPEGAGNPRAAIDTVGVKNDLISLANSERRYFAREGRYASLDELRSAGDTNVQDHRGPYFYTAEASENSFRIIATYTGPPDSEAARSFTVDENMQIR